MNDIFLIVIIVLLVGIVGFLIRREKSKGKNEDSASLLLMQNQLTELRATLDSKLGDSTKQMNETVRSQFSESQRTIKEANAEMVKHLTNVTKVVTEANEAGKQIFTLAGQLQNLEKVLTHQKQRGSLGEASLELTLSNMLPVTAYKMQYHFHDGDIVDAVILAREGMIPVDAKFSLDNYNRLVNEENGERKLELERDFKNDIKKRIDEVAKYIKPKEGTLSFAFMFIPAEGIYYDLLVNEIGSVKANTRSLLDYAQNERNVIIVSPTTFSAYLMSVLYGFKAFKIEESAKKIGEYVEQLNRHLAVYEQYFTSVGNSLGTTVNHYNKAFKEYKKIDKDVLKITGSSNEVKILEIDRPQTED